MMPSRFLQEVPQDLLAGPHASGDEAWQAEAFDQDSDWNEPGIDLYSERKTVRQIAEGRLLEAAAKSGEGKGRKPYGGESYDSVDNLAKFFSKRGLPFDPSGRPASTRPGSRTQQHPAPRPPAARGATASTPQRSPVQRSPAQGSPAQNAPPRRPQQQTLLGLGPEPAPSPPRTASTSPRTPNSIYPPRAKAPTPPRFATRPVARGPFRPGTKVRHAKFGVGTVMRLEGEGENQKLSINFAGYGMKKVVLKYAGLQRA
jgi:DNA helicase-2/ATP-dependent DNA helicase PcrA